MVAAPVLVSARLGDFSFHYNCGVLGTLGMVAWWGMVVRSPGSSYHTCAGGREGEGDTQVHATPPVS